MPANRLRVNQLKFCWTSHARSALLTIGRLRSRTRTSKTALKMACYAHVWICHAILTPFLCRLKPVFHLATLFARREVKTRIRHRDWLELAGEKIHREQVVTVPTFLPVRANKFAKWKTGFRRPRIRSKST